ncbi:lysophospholipid acyltransferase family protein [bacterium]|nr:lysophospholipid acyltransferase family protein [bacterium]
MMTGFFWFIHILPSWVQNAMTRVIATLGYDVFRIRRKMVYENLKRCFPDWSQQKVSSVARLSFYNQAQIVVDFANMIFMKPEDILKNCSFENKHILENALLEKKGVMLLGCHLSNGDYGIAALSQSGIPIYLISKHFSNKTLDDLYFKTRGRFGTKFINPRRSSFDILKTLKNNGVVIFVLDQFMGPPLGVKTTFFGHETGTAVGLALFAEKTKVPVIPCYAYRKKDGSYCVRFEEVIPFEYHDGDRDESLQKMTQKYNDKLEQVARQYPEQWLWLHRRWKVFR